jgi:hypothetical protein
MVYWPYTRLDGFMAMAAQSPDELEDSRAVVDKVAASVKDYMNGTAAKWYADYAKAYAKMMSVGEYCKAARSECRRLHVQFVAQADMGAAVGSPKQQRAGFSACLQLAGLVCVSSQVKVLHLRLLLG